MLPLVWFWARFHAARTLKRPASVLWISASVVIVGVLRLFGSGSPRELVDFEVTLVMPLLAMLFAPKRRIRLLAALTTLVTFVGPYVYFWLHGRGYPPYVPIVIVGLTLASVLLEANRYRQEQGLRRRYRSVSAAASGATSALAETR